MIGMVTVLQEDRKLFDSGISVRAGRRYWLGTQRLYPATNRARGSAGSERKRGRLRDIVTGEHYSLVAREFDKSSFMQQIVGDLFNSKSCE